jgi:hypothetical protein
VKGLNSLGSVAQVRTLRTTASGPDWQTFTLKIAVPRDSSLLVRFIATPSEKGQTPDHLYIGLDKVSLQRYQPVGNCLAQ